MMTDRWLSSCLVDSDGRIFIDRDGDAFGDILRYLRGGADFLLELVHSSTSHNNNGGGGTAYGSNATGLENAAGSSSIISKNNMDRLRRLRTEADYYGLHQLVADIDCVTIGQKIVFANTGWARVAGGCRPRNQQPVQNQNNPNNNQNDNAAPNGANDQDVENGNDQNQQEEQEGDDNQVMNENENNDEEEAEEEEQFADEEEEEEDEEGQDPNQPPPYKHWSWCNQYGNPDILRPHPTHTSSMVVGQDGSYLLLLRLAAALPSPLARIKWDQEEEEGRRVTRGAIRRRSSRRRPSSNESEEEVDMDGISSPGRSKELEEDYFVTVNIEAPLQTVMDSVDESQTHFPLLRSGLWDYRTEEEVLNEDPVFATFCGTDVVSLRAGDILSVSFMNDEVSRERSPFPDNAPPELVNSLTLVKVYGNTLARYERLKSSPSVMQAGGLMEHHPRRGGDKGAGTILASPPRKTPRGRKYTPFESTREHMDEESPDDIDLYQSQLDCEAEEFDRSLTRTAHWTKTRNDFLPTPFHPPLRSHCVEFPHPGHYLLLGRVALGCRRDATFHSVLSGGPIEGHRAQLSVRSVGGRLLHAVGFVFEDKPRLEWADLSILSENALFNDVVHVPQAGSELSITTTGDCRLHPEGTEVGPFCSAVSQSLSCLLLDDELMEVDRYMVGTVRNASINQREVKWFHTRSASAPSGQGKGGTPSKPSLFEIDGHRLVWRGCRNNFHLNDNGNDRPSTNTAVTVLIMGSIPPLHRGYVLSLLKNGDPIAISITPESLDIKGRHPHYFQEVVELCEGDEIAIAECAYGGEGDWRDQLHIESVRVEFDTRIGHLSFVVLHSADSD
ncbi:hypothetical protein ACHAXR_012353 [Thalassiosira sp. AJA248-18]